MRTTFKVLFYANRSKESGGHIPVLCRITINGTVAPFSCKISVPAKLWNPRTGRLTPGKDTFLLGGLQQATSSKVHKVLFKHAMRPYDTPRP